MLVEVWSKAGIAHREVEMRSDGFTYYKEPHVVAPEKCVFRGEIDYAPGVGGMVKLDTDPNEDRTWEVAEVILNLAKNPTYVTIWITPDWDNELLEVTPPALDGKGK